MKRIPWYVPGTCAAIFCGGIAIANLIQHHYGWAALDGALTLVNLSLIAWLAYTRRKAREARAKLDQFLRELDSLH